MTYEWEGVPASAARFLAGSLPVRPGDRPLEAAQDRLAEKEAFQALGIATAEYRVVGSHEDLDAAVAAIGLPAVLKTRRGGYDGKGQVVLRDVTDLDAAWDALGATPLFSMPSFRSTASCRSWPCGGLVGRSRAGPSSRRAP